MKPQKPFRTVEQQIELLKSRGISVSDPDTCAAYLLSNNYYSVVNGYKQLLLDPNKTCQDVEVYREGADLMHLILLHKFDRMLRTTTVDSILIAEERLKNSSVYSFCGRYPSQDSYLDPANYALRDEYESTYGRGLYTKNLIKLLSTLQGLHDGRQRTDYIDHYRRHYSDVPLWVLSKGLTFGNASAFYSLQKRGVQNDVAKNVSLATGKRAIKPDQIRWAYTVLVPFRNICAHGERLFCARVGKRGQYSYADLVRALRLVLDDEEFDMFTQLAIKGTVGTMNRIPALYEQILGLMKLNHIQNHVTDTERGAAALDMSDEEVSNEGR